MGTIKYFLFLYIFVLSSLYADQLQVPAKGEAAFLTETRTVGTTALSVHTTATSEPELKSLLATVTGSNTVFLLDGTIAATNTGHLIVANNSVFVQGSRNCRNFSYVSLGTSTVTLTYFR